MASPARRTRGGTDDGAAVVEFVLVGILLITLFLAILQVGIALHVRNTLVASAAEGARYGANADRTPADGAAYAAGLIGRSLSPRFGSDVRAGYESNGRIVAVTVTSSIPVIGFIGPPRSLRVTGHALAEGDRDGGAPEVAP